MSASSNQHLTISPIKAFNDNYIWCIHDDLYAVVVDPGDASAVNDFLEAHDLQLTNVLVTHHHHDHVGGLVKLAQDHPDLIIYGPDNSKIKGIDKIVKEGETIAIEVFDLSLKVFEVPGHTLDHIAFYNDEILFCGDTLFSGGCGRMFEGTPVQFHRSLEKLKSLNPNTKVYCAHEYTLANLSFASTIEPTNQALQSYYDEVKQLRSKEEISLPSTIAKEKEINPFLRCHTPDLQSLVTATFNNKNFDSIEVATFAHLRQLKDQF